MQLNASSLTSFFCISQDTETFLSSIAVYQNHHYISDDLHPISLLDVNLNSSVCRTSKGTPEQTARGGPNSLYRRSRIALHPYHGGIRNIRPLDAVTNFTLDDKVEIICWTPVKSLGVRGTRGCIKGLLHSAHLHSTALDGAQYFTGPSSSCLAGLAPDALWIISHLHNPHSNHLMGLYIHRF